MIILLTSLFLISWVWYTLHHMVCYKMKIDKYIEGIKTNKKYYLKENNAYYCIIDGIQIVGYKKPNIKLTVFYRDGYKSSLLTPLHEFEKLWTDQPENI